MKYLKSFEIITVPLQP